MRTSRPSVPVALDATTTALIVVDMQRCYVERGEALDRTFGEDDEARAYYFGRLEHTVVPQCARLVAAFRGHGRPIYFVTFGTASVDGRDLSPRRRRRSAAVGERYGVQLPPVVGSAAHQVIPQLAPQGDEQVLNKVSTSAFITTALGWQLRQNGVTGVVVVGVGTSGCVEGTARDAVDLGFECVVVEDATGDFDEESRAASLTTFQRLFGEVWPAARVLDLLSGAVAAEVVPVDV